MTSRSVAVIAAPVPSSPLQPRSAMMDTLLEAAPPPCPARAGGTDMSARPAIPKDARPAVRGTEIAS
jgi:hypothetical protein